MASSASSRVSSGSASPAFAASNKAHQMEVEAPVRAPETSAHATSPTKAHFVEQELIPPTSRLSRLPTTVPSSSTTLPRSADKVAISAFQNHNTTYSGQDVHVSVNNSASRTPSTATRNFGQPSTLETPVSSSSPPIPQHVLTHPIRRPRTSKHIFQSSSDLAAHYGIPQILPPAPRTNQYTQPSAPQPSPVNDFQTLSANYLNMLSRKPAENTMPAPTTPPMMLALTQSELDAPVIPSDTMSDLQNLEEILASPEFRDQDFFDFDFNTSPMMPGMDDFVSPEETPYSEFLNTPLFSDEPMLTSPMMEWNTDMPLFGGVDFKEDEFAAPPKAPQPTTFDDLYTISPETPALHSFPEFPGAPTSRSVPAPAATTTATEPAPRRSKATGIRKGVTPDSLLGEDAPTQPRKYATPSATSKKDLPAVFARKRSRSAAFGEEEDQLDDLPPNPTEKDLIEQKRRQNTVAARRSRKRKLEQFQMMEQERDEERRQKEMWKERANVLLSTIRGMGVPYHSFPEDEPNMYADS